MTAPFGEVPPSHQYELISPTDCYADLDRHQKRDLRAHLARVVMTNLAIMYELTDMLVADGEEAKSRRKRVEFPEHFLVDGGPA